MTTRYLSLAALLLLASLAAWYSSQFMAGIWYFDMDKPGWAPLKLAWGPIWGVSYVLSALAAWLAWDSGHHQRLAAMAWWLAHLLLIVAWNVAFFGLNRSGWAWMVLTAGLGVTVFCLITFRRISTPAAWAMLPTAAWLAYLWVFTLAVWTINGGWFSSILN
jgi:tryptophan-rich sensory protein